MGDAKIVAQDNDLGTGFKEQRRRKKKMMPGEKCVDEAFGLTQEEKFLIEVIDGILSEMNNRINALKGIDCKFGFLNGSQIHKTDAKVL